MGEKIIYDLGIVGGGLAGLSLAILQAKSGKKVVLFEKNQYPAHKVCGEYISLESWDFINSLGIDLDVLKVPIITKLLVTSPKGTAINSNLDLGGFGISRYKLDYLLYEKCIELGVKVYVKTIINSINKYKGGFELKTNNETHQSKKVVSAHGKRSNLDIEWKRPFIQKHRTSLNQYIGVKYHIKYDFPKDLIALHNFKDGYCGISAIENNTYCLCYLTTKKNLKESNNDIKTMEKNILQQNPFLKKIFNEATFLWEKPEIISQISFEKKSNKENNIYLCGDAAGMITPLCGNGMSMALHSAFLLNQNLEKENSYSVEWAQNFSTRLQVGRLIQSMFGNVYLTEILIKTCKLFPFLLKPLIKATHGEVFGVGKGN